ncbi:MAG: hypothetical protein IPK93_04575 [Solirubrobacterales bacterium]|nr:hypothetical protein [Solirubrobacterales bacterium]
MPQFLEHRHHLIRLGSTEAESCDRVVETLDHYQGDGDGDSEQGNGNES